MSNLEETIARIKKEHDKIVSFVEKVKPNGDEDQWEVYDSRCNSGIDLNIDFDDQGKAIRCVAYPYIRGKTYVNNPVEIKL
jgi:hypothetical protein